MIDSSASGYSPPSRGLQVRNGGYNFGSSEEPVMTVCGEWIGQLHSTARRTLADVTSSGWSSDWQKLLSSYSAYSICVNCLEPGTESLLAGCSRPDALGLNINLNNGFNCVYACFWYERTSLKRGRVWWTASYVPGAKDWSWLTNQVWLQVWPSRPGLVAERPRTSTWMYRVMNELFNMYLSELSSLF